MMTNIVFTQEMEGTHRLAEVVMEMVIVTMTLAMESIADHHADVMLNQTAVDHYEAEVQVQVQMEVTQAVADENVEKVTKDKRGI